MCIAKGEKLVAKYFLLRISPQDSPEFSLSNLYKNCEEGFINFSLNFSSRLAMVKKLFPYFQYSFFFILAYFLWHGIFMAQSVFERHDSSCNYRTFCKILLNEWILLIFSIWQGQNFFLYFCKNSVFYGHNKSSDMNRRLLFDLTFKWQTIQRKRLF